jgi:hypothetical protein
MLRIAAREIWMLDNIGILVSSVTILLVIVSAVRMDRTQAWFQTVTRKQQTEPTQTPVRGTWRRRG